MDLLGRSGSGQIGINKQNYPLVSQIKHNILLQHSISNKAVIQVDGISRMDQCQGFGNLNGDV